MRFSDIEEEIRNVLDIDEADMTEEQRALFPAYLAELAGQETGKVDSVGQFCRLGNAKADAVEAESKRLARLAKTIRNNIQWIQNGMKETMLEHGLKKISGNVYTISIRTNQIVRIDNEAAIPAEFWREKVERTVDKLAIRDALKAGQDVAGARMGESFSLQVR